MKFSEFLNKLDLSAPVNANIEVTSKCNLNCIFCSAEANNISNHDELSISDLLNLADDLRDLKIFNVKITGGEPFVKKDIMPFLSKLSRNHRISINTNGTLLTERIVSELSRLNIETVIVSLDSSNRITNDRLRSEDSFEKIVEGIKNLKKFKIPVYISAVLTRLNINEITELARFVKRLGFSHLGVNNIYPKGRAKDMDIELAPTYNELESFCLEINEFNKTNKNIFISFEQAHWYGMKNSIDKSKTGIEKRQKRYLLPCHAGVNQIGILANGDVVPCLLLDDFVAGNIKRDKIADIWKDSPVFKKMKELAVTEVQKIESCSKCKFRYYCSGGCRAKAYLHSNNLLGRDPECPHTTIENFEKKNSI